MTRRVVDQPPVTIHAIVPREGAPQQCVVDWRGRIISTEMQPGDTTYESAFRRLGRGTLGAVISVGQRDTDFEAANIDPDNRRNHRVYRAEDPVDHLPDRHHRWATPSVTPDLLPKAAFKHIIHLLRTR